MPNSEGVSFDPTPKVHFEIESRVRQGFAQWERHRLVFDEADAKEIFEGFLATSSEWEYRLTKVTRERLA